MANAAMGGIMIENPPCQLYLISPLDVGGDFPALLESALSAGPVAAFQYRVKDMSAHDAARLAEPLQDICAAHDVAFIVNDSISLAKRLKADGVHLGQGDGDIKEAREELGPNAQIGVTCHNSRHLAMEAGEAGADYVAFGAFYPTTTKDVEHVAEIETLEKWSRVMEIPCVAIGGITPENAKPIINAGADFIAASSAVWQHADGPAAGVQEFNAVLAQAAIAR
jgi:thiamine-phosphate pyrophosphorylase